MDETKERQNGNIPTFSNNMFSIFEHSLKVLSFAKFIILVPIKTSKQEIAFGTNK